jgi:hypothetical protein
MSRLLKLAMEKKSSKEMFHPHVPVGIPCYDFIMVPNNAVDAALPKVKLTAWSSICFLDVTGGVYKARERIHRRIADRRLLAIPTSWRRVAASNLN